MNEQAYPVAVMGLTNLLAKVADLKPIVDRDRHALARGPDLPQSLADVFLQAGFGRLWAPREYGGAELGGRPTISRSVKRSRNLTALLAGARASPPAAQDCLVR